MSKPATPHDIFFTLIFSELGHARGLCEGHLPAELVAAVDWSGLKRLSSELLGSDLSTRSSDLCFSVPWRDGRRSPAVVMIIPEHQSTVDLMMAHRLLRYLVRVWDRYAVEHPACTRLPLLIPIVLYSGRPAWTVPVNTADRLSIHSELRAALQPYLPSWSYQLIDLHRAAETELFGTPVGRLCLMLLRASAGSRPLSGW